MASVGPRGGSSPGSPLRVGGVAAGGAERVVSVRPGGRWGLSVGVLPPAPPHQTLAAPPALQLCPLHCPQTPPLPLPPNLSPKPLCKPPECDPRPILTPPNAAQPLTLGAEQLPQPRHLLPQLADQPRVRVLVDHRVAPDLLCAVGVAGGRGRTGAGSGLGSPLPHPKTHPGSPGCSPQRAQRLLVVAVGRAQRRDHGRARVPACGDAVSGG